MKCNDGIYLKKSEYNRPAGETKRGGRSPMFEFKASHESWFFSKQSSLDTVMPDQRFAIEARTGKTHMLSLTIRAAKHIVLQATYNDLISWRMNIA